MWRGIYFPAIRFRGGERRVGWWWLKKDLLEAFQGEGPLSLLDEPFRMPVKTPCGRLMKVTGRYFVSVDLNGGMGAMEEGSSTKNGGRELVLKQGGWAG